MALTKQTQQELPVQDANNQVTVTANAVDILDAAFAGLSVKSISTATPPGSPTNGDRYLVPASGTGDWFGWDDSIAFRQSGSWIELPPQEGWTLRLDGTTERYRYDGSAWVECSIETGTITTGITASVTQTQGQGPLTSSVNYIETCATTNDTVTLPSARKGLMIVVANDGAQTAQVFPASGDSIDTFATDAARLLSATRRILCIATSASHWISMETL